MNKPGQQRVKIVQVLNPSNAILECVIMHGETKEAERLRKKLRELTEKI